LTALRITMKQPYEFNDEARSITIHRVDLPTPWINYLSNGNLHAFVSQAGGGFLWQGEAPNCRLTRYRMHHLPIDSPGFYVYIRRSDGTVWSPTWRPVETALDSWSATHAPGVTTFQAQLGSRTAILRLFIPPDFDTLIWELEIENHGSSEEALDIFSYVELSQYDWLDEQKYGYYWRHMLKTWFSSEDGALLYLYHNRQFARERGIDTVPLLYFASDQQVKSFGGDRDAFMGNYRDERRPLALERGVCGNDETLSGEPCAALHHSLRLTSGSSQALRCFLGVIPGALASYADVRTQLKTTLAQLRDGNIILRQKEKLKAWWEDALRIVQCDIPDASAQRQINIWSPVHLVHIARLERSVNAQAPGVRKIGFRDTCQDMIAMSYRDLPLAKRNFKRLLGMQEVEGNARTASPPTERRKPDLGIGCDQHLWLPMLAYAIAAEGGDLKFLKEESPFLAADLKSAGPVATAWEHLRACVRFTENHLGSHGLPLILRCDWNDIIGRFCEGGKGESIFAAQQFVYVLRLLSDLATRMGERSDVEWFGQLVDQQTRAILEHGWNGKWWYRCFDDNGNLIGDENSLFGKIWINSQSWAVLSGVGTRAQHLAAMDAVETHLDTGFGLVKVAPGFATWPECSDPFSGYNPGNGENGAIFCHSNTWAIIAETMLGNGERAWRYFTNLVPHNALQKLGLDVYKGEPYAWASNIVGRGNPKQGWSNVVHMTGTAAWMDITATQYLLGMRPCLDGLLVDPCVPGWRSFRMERVFRGCRVFIDVSNPEGISRGVKSLRIDGRLQHRNLIPASALLGKSEIHIQAVMGTPE
jgi:cellobiose phosphorylase